MADFITFVIPCFVFLGLALLLLWTMSTSRQDARIAQLESAQRANLNHIVQQFWKHETAINQNAAMAATAQREVVQLATTFARMNTHLDSDPLGETIAETVHTRRTVKP